MLDLPVSPEYGRDKMKVIIPQTKNEEKLFKAIQKANGSLEDGKPGLQTMSDIAIKVEADCFPVTLKIYGMPVIIGNDAILFDPDGPISNFSNCLIGSFSHPRAEKPGSIMVNNGKIIHDQACHAWAGFPEAVIYRLWDGSFGCGEFKTAYELPPNVKWAMGGFGLMGLWNPDGQGFKVINGVDYLNSVTYRTAHGVLAVKNNKVYGVLCKNMTGKEVNDFCINKMKFEIAVMGDGGGLAAINGDEAFARMNQHQRCAYAIQII